MLDAGITWVGPSPAVIEAMGDKLAAKRAAVDVGVPTLRSRTTLGGSEGRISGSCESGRGGGGKGMRIVESAQELAEAVATGRREAPPHSATTASSSRHTCPRARHIEIQILGDSHGNIQHLGERECSIQRRHQKVFEEAPSPVVDDNLRRAMGDAALRLAGAMGYESAGTVEFLLDEETREFYFLEVNTRLQVEHPVTEEVTGVDLVREQLRIAEGRIQRVAPDRRRTCHRSQALCRRP